MSPPSARAAHEHRRLPRNLRQDHHARSRGEAYALVLAAYFRQCAAEAGVTTRPQP